MAGRWSADKLGSEARSGEPTNRGSSTEVTSRVGGDPGDVQPDSAVERQAHDEDASESDLGRLGDGEDEVAYSSEHHIADDEEGAVSAFSDQLSFLRRATKTMLTGTCPNSELR